MLIFNSIKLPSVVLTLRFNSSGTALMMNIGMIMVNIGVDQSVERDVQLLFWDSSFFRIF